MESKKNAIFERIGGVPPKIWCDNTKIIVTKVLKEGERTLEDDFLRISDYLEDCRDCETDHLGPFGFI